MFYFSCILLLRHFVGTWFCSIQEGFGREYSDSLSKSWVQISANIILTLQFLGIYIISSNPINQAIGKFKNPKKVRIAIRGNALRYAKIYKMALLLRN